MKVIDQVAPYREFRVKGHTEEWSDSEILEKIKIRDKLLGKYKKSKLEVDHNIYREAKVKAAQLIKNKKVDYFKQKIIENTGNSKKLWENLNSLVLSSQKSSSATCLKKDGKIIFDPKSNAGIFKDFYSNLASDLQDLQPPSLTTHT